MEFVRKICGLRDAEMASAAVDAGATHIGLVFFPPSPRHVSLQTAKQIMAAISGRATVIVLCVDPTEGDLRDLAQLEGLGGVQFHGAEAPDFIAEARKILDPRACWKALPIAAPGDLHAAKAYESVVDCLLFDARPPKGADRPGGHGAAFDWSILAAYDGAVPFILAGGLTPANVGGAITAMQAVPGFSGVDVSSGVERRAGVKDRDAIKAFLQAAQPR